MFEISNLKMELHSGKRALGCFMWSLSDQFLPLIYKNAGYNCVIIDMEHSTYDLHTVHALVQASRSCGLFPIVRAPEPTKAWIQKIWDLGARGIAMPLMETVEQAKEFVRLSKYPPIGQRGMGPGLGHMDFDTTSDLADYIAKSNDELILLVQPETRKGVDNLDAILDVEGIDGILTGPYDLSVSLGIPGQFMDQHFIEANEKTIRVTQSHKKLVFGFAGNPEQAQKLVDIGANTIFMETDNSLFVKGASATYQILAGLKGV